MTHMTDDDILALYALHEVGGAAERTRRARELAHRYASQHHPDDGYLVSGTHGMEFAYTIPPPLPPEGELPQSQPYRQLFVKLPAELPRGETLILVAETVIYDLLLAAEQDMRQQIEGPVE